MNMNEVELKYNRIQTTAFIAVKPSIITLIPQNKIEQPSGGYKLADGDPRDPQTFRIIELGFNHEPPVVELTDGSQREASFWLLGEWDATVDINDYWTASDPDTGRVRTWLVGDIVRSNHYETRALVVERGK